MVTEVVIPVIDQAGGELMLTKWLKREGERVRAGDVLCELETSKANVEIPADVDGVLGRILIAEGTTIPSLTVIALIASAIEPLPEVDPYYRVTERRAKEQHGADGDYASGVAAAEGSGRPAELKHGGRGRELVASPRARRLAAEHGVDLAAIAGSGPNGRIVEEDVRRAIQQK